MKKLLLPIFIICLVAYQSNAQRGWELGGWIGSSTYFGDLNTQFDLQETGLAAGAIARYNFNNRICMKMTANYLRLSANDANSSNAVENSRNLNFRTDVVDGSLNVEFNFLPYNHGSKYEFFTPYLFGGVSLFYFDPKTDLNGQTYQLRNYGTEGQFKGEEYSSIAPALNYGIGFKMDFSYRWSLNIQLSARKLGTDYIDDVSGNYPAFDDLEGLRGPVAVALSDRSVGPEGTSIAAEGRQRGNGRNNDTYVTLGVGMVYYFGSLKCPPLNR